MVIKMNEIYKKVKKKAIGLYLILGLIVAAVGVAACWFALNAIIKYSTASDDLWEEEEINWEYDNWYACENNIFLGAYAEDRFGSYYITLTEEGHLIGFFVPEREEEKADKIMEDCWLYMDGESWDWPEEHLSGKGYLKSMSVDERKLFDKWFEEYMDVEEGDLVYKTFYLINPWDAIKMEDNVFVTVIGICFFIVGLILVILFLTGNYKKNFGKTLAKYNITEEMLETDMAGAVKKDDIWIGSRYLLAIALPMAIVPYDRLIWAYTHTTITKHRMYGIIPMGTTKSYALKFVDRDNKETTVQVKKEAMGIQILQILTAKAPYIICGYDESLAQMHNINFHAMIDKVEENKLSQPITDEKSSV